VKIVGLTMVKQIIIIYKSYQSKKSDENNGKKMENQQSQSTETKKLENVLSLLSF
jgi:hypothetical protein